MWQTASSTTAPHKDKEIETQRWKPNEGKGFHVKRRLLSRCLESIFISGRYSELNRNVEKQRESGARMGGEGRQREEGQVRWMGGRQ